MPSRPASVDLPIAAAPTWSAPPANRCSGLLADARSLERETLAATAGRGFPRRGSFSFRTLPFRLGVTYAVRSQHMSVVAGDLDAMVAGGAIAAIAFERANPPALAAHRIERIEACELDVECRPGVLVE